MQHGPVRAKGDFEPFRLIRTSSWVTLLQIVPQTVPLTPVFQGRSNFSLDKSEK